MREQLNDKFWAEKQADGTVAVGLTDDYIERLGLIWIITWRNKAGKVDLVKDQPFANVESSKCLGPLRSPINGKVISVNAQFVEYPDTINSDEALFIAETK